MCNPPKIPSMSDISDQLARVNQQARQIIANPLSALSVLVLGPIVGLIGAAVVTDQMQNAAADAASQDNQSQIDAVDQQQTANDQALADAQAASDAADAAAKQAAADALAAQQAAQQDQLVPVDQTLPTAYTPSGPSAMPVSSSPFDTGGGGGGGGGGGMPVDASVLTSQSPFDTGMPPDDLQSQYMQSQALEQRGFGPAPDFSAQPVDQSMFDQDMGPMPAASALEMSPELRQMVEMPMEAGDFNPVDETAQLTMSEGEDQSMSGYGRVTNYPEAEGIAFSRINPRSFEPILSYDERYAPVYHESGPLLPVANRLDSRTGLPSTGFMPALRMIEPDYNSQNTQPQDLPDNLPVNETNYPTHGTQTAVNIKRSVLSTAMPIRSNFGDDPNQPGVFDFMLNDLRSLRDKLQSVIKRAEGFKTYDKRFSGMMNLDAVLAPVKYDLDEVASGVNHVQRGHSQTRPVTHEDQEKSDLAKRMISDMNDDIALVRNFVR